MTRDIFVRFRSKIRRGKKEKKPGNTPGNTRRAALCHVKPPTRRRSYMKKFGRVKNKVLPFLPSSANSPSFR
jgi:hypothetical protein